MVEFTKAQLKKSGSPQPVNSLSPNYCSFTFDPSGDLWEGSTDNFASEWTKAQLALSVYPAPQVTISSSSLAEPRRPTFDSAGDMWAANYKETRSASSPKPSSPNLGPRRHGSRSPRNPRQTQTR